MKYTEPVNGEYEDYIYMEQILQALHNVYDLQDESEEDESEDDDELHSSEDTVTQSM